MQIQPSVTPLDIICAETSAPPTGMVVFGASGDLVRRKLLVSLAQIYRRGLIPEEFFLLGCGRKEYSDDTFRQVARQSIGEVGGEISGEQIDAFVDKLYYTSGDYTGSELYEVIRARLALLNAKHKVDGCAVFYLAVPPFLYGTIAERLGALGLSMKEGPDPCSRARLVVEKPFGRDLQSATALNRTLYQSFDESQIYRIDHYLGKETVQNILIFRFANTIFEPVWNRNYIDHVQVTIAENLGVEHRADYYDESGALRDMFQNHMLQMLSLVAMEPPISFGADHVRDEKVKLLRSIRQIERGVVDEYFVRGQYGRGLADGKDMPAYRAEPGVDPNSSTETFVAAKLFVDNWRWKDVPFYLRTGKRLACKDTEIAVVFKRAPHLPFDATMTEELGQNAFVVRVQPDEGVTLRFGSKVPGSQMEVRDVTMDFGYGTAFTESSPEAYERLILDVLLGEPSLFPVNEEVERSWEILDPVIEHWHALPEGPDPYAAGSWGPDSATRMLARTGRKWRRP